MSLDVDVLVIGGGIKRAGVARDPVGRGLSVLLAARCDYASGTSSASSKLIHGGLRYDSRLVLETLLDARARGADIRNYCEASAVCAVNPAYPPNPGP